MWDRPVQPHKRTRAILNNGLIGLLAAAGCALADTPALHAPHERSWQDIESRIQYGYFTEDAHALSNLTQQLATGGDDQQRGYYEALLAYRLMQLTVSHDDPKPKSAPEPDKDKADKARGRALLERCVTSLDQVLAVEKDNAEGLALQSACLSMAADLDLWWHAPINGMKSGSQLRRALQLAPGNPRVLLLQAVNDVGRAGDKALDELKRAIAAFEAERHDVEHLPAWGAAEAYVLKARIYLRRGDAVTARDALEHALLLAPDYAQARRLLLQITS
jgi:hypothetical protein